MPTKEKVFKKAEPTAPPRVKTPPPLSPKVEVELAYAIPWEPLASEPESTPLLGVGPMEQPKVELQESSIPEPP